MALLAANHQIRHSFVRRTSICRVSANVNFKVLPQALAIVKLAVSSFLILLPVSVVFLLTRGRTIYRLQSETNSQPHNARELLFAPGYFVSNTVNSDSPPFVRSFHTGHAKLVKGVSNTPVTKSSGADNVE